MRQPADHLLHPAFELAPVTPLGEARLSDRERLGVVLQGAAVLSHLDAAGWYLVRGWGEAGVARGGELCGLEAAPGRRRALCQRRLVDLVEALFGGGEVAGRGAARRVVRILLDRWRQSLAPAVPDRVVREILEEAPFLWDRDLGAPRAALAAEMERAGERSVLVAGGGGWRRHLVNGHEVEALRRRLAGPDAREIWDGGASGDPRALAAAGRWRGAVAAWSRHPPETAADRLAQAEALLALGRFTSAVAVLDGVRGGADDSRTRLRAETLRLEARLLLGEPGGVRRRLGQLARESLPPEIVAPLAEVAVRAHGQQSGLARARAWIDRALAETRGAERRYAELVAAVGAWDRGDLEAMRGHLDAARPALEEPGRPDLAWRWHHAAGLAAMAENRSAEIVGHLSRALATGRRALRRHQAGGLWNDLGIGRARSGDLAGAERAFRHAQRLHDGCDGPRRTTLALYNLAEVRLRRGRATGVEEILERSTAENRASGNVRGLVHDLALAARYELVLGRPEAALSRVAEGLELLAAKRLDWHRAELHLFEARALGWLGRAEEAARALEEVAPEALGELEAEELPAVYALAGETEKARARARGTLWEGLWWKLLDGGEAPVDLWRPLSELEPYRAARVVFDAERLRPGAAPGPWRRRAVAAFRRLGAGWCAERLELGASDPWRALTRYLDSGRGELPALRRMFEDAGYPEVRIEWRPAGAGGADVEILIGGPGGADEIATPLDDGLLILRADGLDTPLRALFALALGDLRRHSTGAGRASAARGAGAAGASLPGGLVGESPGLRAAVVRVERLAPSEVPVLILGESGTGKELVARHVHRSSPRSRAPFVAVNCAALGETLLLSDLFGHVRGSFTGADRDRAGVFETATGGTVFLDEIGDLPASAQGMLLRVLQEGEVRRVGESLARKVDARVVAATHRDLDRMVEEGSFRQDLFFRLDVARIELPPLRERGRDVLHLAEGFLAAEGGGGPGLSSAAKRALMAHRWPGNVRELENVLSVAVALAGAGPIEPEHLELSPDASGRARAATPPAAEVDTARGGDYHARVEEFRRRLVEEALKAAGGNQAEAARRLGLTRQALSYLVKKLRLG